MKCSEIRCGLLPTPDPAPSSWPLTAFTAVEKAAFIANFTVNVATRGLRVISRLFRRGMGHMMMN